MTSPYTAQQLQVFVALETGVTAEEMRGPLQIREVVAARHLAMALVSETLKLSTPRIGKLFGGRDHSTVISAIKRARVDPKLAELRSKLHNGGSVAPEIFVPAALRSIMDLRANLDALEAALKGRVK